MTSSTQSSQAEQNPLGNRKNPGCSFFVCFGGRKELEMTRKSGRYFHLLPHDEWAPPSSTLRALFVAGQARTSTQELGFRSGKPKTRAASRAHRGTAPPAFLAPSAPRPERTPVPASLGRQPFLQSRAARGRGPRRTPQSATYRQKTCSHRPRDTGSRRTPALWAEEREKRQF